MRKPFGKNLLRACLGLQLRVARKRLLALLAMGLAALLLSAAVAVGAQQLFAGQGFAGMHIAVASEEDDERIDLLLDVLAGMQDVQGFADIQKAAPSEVESLVRSGAVNAAVVLPQGFVQSLMTGENLPPKLVLDASRPLEAMMVAQLAENAARMLAKAQQAVGYAAAVYSGQQAQTPPLNEVLAQVNLRFAVWVLQRGEMFRTVLVNPTGALMLAQHYLLCALLFFAMLCVPVLYRLYSLQEQKGWLARMRGAGCGVGVWMASQVAVGALALFLLLCLLLAAGLALGAGFSLWVLPGLALAALFLSCFGFVLCNLGGPLSSVSLGFLLSLAFWVMAGGVVPLVLLPAPVAALAPLSPLVWLRDALAPLFGAPGSLGALGALGGGCAVLLALGYLQARAAALAGREATP